MMLKKCYNRLQLKMPAKLAAYLGYLPLWPPSAAVSMAASQPGAAAGLKNRVMRCLEVALACDSVKSLYTWAPHWRAGRDT